MFSSATLSAYGWTLENKQLFQKSNDNVIKSHRPIMSHNLYDIVYFKLPCIFLLDDIAMQTSCP